MRDDAGGPGETQKRKRHRGERNVRHAPDEIGRGRGWGVSVVWDAVGGNPFGLQLESAD